MQTPMFVFSDLRKKWVSEDIEFLLIKLQQSFAVKEISIDFTRKDNLLSSRFDGVSYYVAYMKDRSELKDWRQMAKDFELTSKPNPIDKKGLETRYQAKKMSSPGLYKEIHYFIGEIIFEEMNKVPPVEIYFYQ
jgi:hypothetical protein